MGIIGGLGSYMLLLPKIPIS